MKIVMFSDSFEPSVDGVVTQIKNMVCEFTKNGHSVFLVAPSHLFEYKQVEKYGAKIFLLPSISLPSYKDYKISSFFSFKVMNVVSEFNPDVIHVHTPFSCGLFGVICAKRFHKPLVGTYHTLIPDFLVYLPLPLLNKTDFAKKLAWFYTKHFYNKCNVVTVPSISLSNELSLHGFNNLVFFPNSIDFEKFNKFAKSSYFSNSFRLVYFGRIGFEKNIDVVIRALGVLRNKGVNANLSIIGFGPAEYSLKSLVSELCLSSFVSFLGSLPHDALPFVVSNHDVFVTASTIETQCLALIEAMALGLPCVGANARAIPEAITDGETGFLFAPGDFQECAEKLFVLARSKKLREKFGKAGIAYAKNFSIEKTYEKNIEIYNKVLKDFYEKA
ncbi:MAG: glycosyltransferase [Candidatus Diapherotrites archaeon]